MNKQVDLIKRQVAQLLKNKGQKNNSLEFINIEEDLLKVVHDKKFVCYLNLKKIKDLKQSSKELVNYKNSLANKIISNIKEKSYIRNIVCLIPVWRSHNLLDKSIVSLQKQSMVPHIILLVSSDIDKNYALTRGLEFVEVKNNVLGNKFQTGIKYVESNYPFIYGIIICSGFEIYTENWVKDCFESSSEYDIIGHYHDYLISNFSDLIYKRSINQKKYRDIVSRNYRDNYIMGFGRYIKKSILDKLNWRVFSEKDNNVDIPSFERLCQCSPSIGSISSSSMITIYQGQDLETHIKIVKAKDFLEIEKIDSLPKEEETLVSRLVIKNAIASTKIFMKPKKVIKPQKELPELEIPKKPLKLVQNPKPVKPKVEEKPVKTRAEPVKPKDVINGLAKPKRMYKGSFKKQNTINDYFEKVFVINSDKSLDKMKKIQESFKKHSISFERVVAIDGTNPKIVANFRRLKGSRVGNAKAYGNLLSHIKTVEIARKKGYKNILIFEEEVVLHSNLNKMLSKFNSIPENWDLIYLGSDNECNERVVDNSYYRAKNVSGSFAYGVSRKCYNDILRWWKKQDQPVDKVLQIIQARNNSYVIFENLVISSSSPSKTEDKSIKPNKNTANLNSYEYIGTSPLHKISVVLPTYNGYPLIKRCIESIRDQSYQNWELVIVNDGSTDKNLLTYLKSVKSWKIRVINLHKNSGLPYALNRGLENCNGNYWTWISDDNEFTQDAFLYLKTEIDKGYKFVYSNFYFVNELDNKTVSHTCKLEKYIYKNIIQDWKGMACYLWRMNAIKKIGMFNEDYQGVEDFDYVIRTFVWLHNQIGFVEKVLLKYYRRDNTITTRMGSRIPEMKKIIVEKYNDIDTFRKLIETFSKYKTTFIYVSGEYNSIYDGRAEQILNHLSDSANCVYVSKLEGTNESLILKNRTYYLDKRVFNHFLEFFTPPNSKIVYIFSDPRMHHYKGLIEPKQTIFDFYRVEEYWNHDVKIAVDCSDLVLTPSRLIKEKVKDIYKKDQILVLPNSYDYSFISKEIDGIDDIHRTPGEIRDLKNTGKKVFGYFGAIDGNIDVDLLNLVAQVDELKVVTFVESNYDMNESVETVTALAKEDLIRYIWSLDGFVLPFKACYDFVPTIFYKCLYFRKPIIYSGFSVGNEITGCYPISKDNLRHGLSNAIQNDFIQIDNTKHVQNWSQDLINLMTCNSKEKRDKSVLRVGLVGNYGFNLYGDEIVKTVYGKFFPNSQFVIMHDFERPPYFNEDSLTSKISKVDLIIISGAVIQPNYCSNLFWNRKFLRKPVYLFNLSLDRSVNIFDRHEVKKLKNFVDHHNIKYISSANSKTKKWIKDNLDLNCKLQPDVGFYYPEAFSLKPIKTNKTLGLILKSYHELDKINGFGKFATERGFKVKYIELSTNGVVQNINIVNNLTFDKRIVTGCGVKEITEELLSCDIIFSDEYYSSLMGLVNGRPVVILNKELNDLYEHLGIEEKAGARNLKDYLDFDFNKYLEGSSDTIKKLQDSVEGSIREFKSTIIKNHLRVVHFGSYWQKDNDIVKLMVKDLFDVCNCTEVDVQIYGRYSLIGLAGSTGLSSGERWYDNYEPEPNEYPNKYIRYLKEDKIKSIVENIKPHVIITNSGGLTFTDDTFEFLNERNILTVGLSMSDPDVYPYNGKVYAGKYDYFFTNSLHSLESQYDSKVNVDLMPFACSTSLHKPMNIVKTYDIVVLGGYRPDRVIIINELKNHFKVGVYGSGWPESYKAVKVHGQDHVKALNRGHIYISFGLTAAGFTNVKVGIFEAAACKVALITDRTDEIKNYFKEDKEVLLYSSIPELIKKVRWLLEDRYRMSMFKKKSYERFIKNHTWKKRWNDALVKIV